MQGKDKGEECPNIKPYYSRRQMGACPLSVATFLRQRVAAMAKTAASIDANTFAFFTRNPRGGKAKAIDDADVRAFAQEAALAGIGRIVAHGSYTVNPCAAKEQVRSFAFQALAEDLARMECTPGQLFNIHPGSHVGQGAGCGYRAYCRGPEYCVGTRANHHAFVGNHGRKGK